MNKQQFDYLVVNMTAIVNHAFTMQCGEFATALAKDDPGAPEVVEFDSSKHFQDFDFDELIKSGYEDLADVSDVLDQKREKVDIDLVEFYLAALPKEYENLCGALSGNGLKQWIEYALVSEQGSPLYQLHACLANQGFEQDEPVAELIREAIAFDELEGLSDIESIPADQVSESDFILAATIQSFKVFAWMAEHAQLTDQQVTAILEGLMDFPESFTAIYPMLNPGETVKSHLLEKAVSHPPIHQYLQSQ